MENQIKERDIMVLGEYTGINPNQDFYIADKSLMLFYQLYDLAPYAYGIPYFPISLFMIFKI
ncbi:RsiV family protein [Priestia flexa]|uniref:RsiV family protein n=1 Tax=Priestia flexa TaxID=86664 RepID=UPI002DBFF555|nr:RsiV family protein [Priestia flexa]MEC0667603.1 RsiV family protein [Priestia flexa]